jgi:hypothetical protein
MRNLEQYPWLPALAAAFTLTAMAVRCLTLLIGLLATLMKAYPSDRPEIFREFARAASGRRSTSKPLPAKRRLRKDPEILKRATSFSSKETR